jgi:hypothetical protein
MEAGVMAYVLLLAFGVFSLGYGIYMMIVRKRTPQKLGKLDAMRKRFGTKLGFVLHFVSYSLLPITAGSVMILLGVIMLL